MRPASGISNYSRRNEQFFVYLSTYLSKLSPSPSFCMSLIKHPPLPRSVYLLRMSLFTYLIIDIFLSISCYLCLSDCLLPTFLFFCKHVIPSAHASLPVCLPLCSSVFLPVFPPSCLSVYISVHISVTLLACLLACQPPYLLPYMPTCLPAYLSVNAPICI